jgi:hypothetical protein
MNLQFDNRKRPRPGPRRGVRRSQTMILAERTERDLLGIETARTRHAQWLANRSARPPDMWDERAALEAEQAHVAEVRLLAELHAELEAERRSETAERPHVYVPSRTPTMGRSTLNVDATSLRHT